MREKNKTRKSARFSISKEAKMAKRENSFPPSSVRLGESGESIRKMRLKSARDVRMVRHVRGVRAQRQNHSKLYRLKLVFEYFK